ncbi:MAG: AAA family ATPase [Acidimicrobiia bacterium]
MTIETADGELRHVGAGRPAAVLAMLLCRPNERVSTQELIEEIWGKDTSSNRASLRNMVTNLRHLFEELGFEEEILANASRGYRLAVDLDGFDVEQFRRSCRAGAVLLEAGDIRRAELTLRSAVELWAGDPFSSVRCPSVFEVARELQAQRAEAKRLLSRAQDALRRWEAGERFTIDPPPAGANDGLPAALRPTGEPFVGREGLLDELSSLLASCEAEPGLRGLFVVLDGEAGMGKSTLLSRISGGMTGWRIGYAAADEGRDAPLGAWQRALLDVGIDLGVLRSTVIRTGSSAELSELAELLQTSLASAARQAPVALVFDDVQWLHPRSRALLVDLVRVGLPPRSAVIVAVRTSRAPNDAGSRVCAQLAALRGATTREVPPLTVDDLDVLVSQVRPTMLAYRRGVIATHLHRLSQGNPWLCWQLLRRVDLGEIAVTDGRWGSPILHQPYLTAGLDALTPTVRTLVDTASVIGSAFLGSQLAALAGVPVSEVVATLDEAVASGIVVADRGPDRYRFEHGILRQLVYDSVLPGRRAVLHGQLGALLSNSPSTAVESARHLLAGLGPIPAERALSTALATARSCAAAGAYEDAAELLRRVIDASADHSLPEGEHLLDLRIEHARQSELAGDRDAAFDAASAAYHLAVAQGDVPAAARAALMATGHGRSLAGTDLHVGLLSEAIALVSTTSSTDPSLQIELNSELIYRRALVGDPQAGLEEPMARLRRMMDSRPVDNPYVRAVALRAELAAAHESPDPGNRASRSIELFTLAQVLDDLDLESDAMAFLASNCLSAWQISAVEPALDEFVERNGGRLRPVDRWGVATARATLAELRRDAATAAAHALAARKIGERHDVVDHDLTYLVFLVARCVLRRQHHDIQELTGLLPAELITDDALVCTVQAVAAALNGDVRTAKRALGPAVAELAGPRRPIGWLGFVCLAAEATHLAEDADSADELMQLLEPHLGTLVTLGVTPAASVGPAARYAARLAHIIGDTRRATTLFAQATELCDRHGYRL